MKKFISLLLLTVISIGLQAQGTYTRPCDNEKLVKKARTWMFRGKWQQGFTAALPHETVNLVEFYEQYRKNAKQWKAAFKWLAKTDLRTIPSGKHPIPGTTLVASVEDSKNGPLEKRNSESHYHHVDLQYVVSGTERFGIIEHESSTPKDQWRDDVIHYNYDLSKARFYDSAPDRFFIFFPSDWHIAKVENDSNDQGIRVIVIKLDYVE
ncbi:MAG: YhcH/YjgK/YiaL family protein [Prevotella sp.]|nr:YhcH/YjgK/YiaL family protein [Prevotella sp.]